MFSEQLLGAEREAGGAGGVTLSPRGEATHLCEPLEATLTQELTAVPLASFPHVPEI